MNMEQTAQPPIHWYRGFVQGKTRIILAWAFAALLVLSARHYPTWPGILLCALGASLRYWASGYLRKDSRPAVGGPYAYVRNPLYLGTYLMALGAALAAGSLWIFGALTVFFAAIYHFIILDEETKLRRIFGEPYLRYCESVPRFFPIPFPRLPLPFRRASTESLREVNPEATHHQFSGELANRNKAYEAYATFVALIGFLALTAWAWQTF
jgi:protein-S-isoprenylcysteine O-methyltransferase Ste14